IALVSHLDGGTCEWRWTHRLFRRCPTHLTAYPPVRPERCLEPMDSLHEAVLSLRESGYRPDPTWFDSQMEELRDSRLARTSILFGSPGTGFCPLIQITTMMLSIV